MEPTPADAYRAWLKAPDAVRARARWLLQARPKQLPPKGAWFIWLVLAGRGFGKTRLAAEDMAYFALTNPGVRLAVLAPRYSDCRDTCVEGESGLLSVIPRSHVETWNRTMGELVLVNGARFKMFSASEPDRLRGPQHHRAWVDELASLSKPEALDRLLMGLRLGEDPRLVMTTTPKQRGWLRELTERPDVVVTRGSMAENAENLSPTFVREMESRYAGTRIGRQELEGELLEDSERALVRRPWIESCRVDHEPEGLVRLNSVGLDPGGEKAQALCLVGSGLDGFLYVKRSEMVEDSATDFLRHAIRIAATHDAVLVVEKNHGGDYLVELLNQVMRDLGIIVPVKIVWASLGKRARAEPVGLLIEQGKVKWLGPHPQLEDEWCSWEADSGDPSPHLLDAMVWACSSLTGSATVGHETELEAVPYR